jgi:hypothetical protein
MNSRWSAQGSFLVSSSHTIQTGILPYAMPFPVPWDGPPNEAAGWTRFQVNPPPKYFSSGVSLPRTESTDNVSHNLQYYAHNILVFSRGYLVGKALF